MLLAAIAGMPALVAGVTAAAVIAVVAYHPLAGIVAGIRSWRPLVPLAFVTLATAVVTSALLVPSMS